MEKLSKEECVFFFSDRVQKIQSINSQFDLEKNAYIAYSGGKDSDVLSDLIDCALPKNKIPRVFINTGIEYKLVLEHVKEKKAKDDRIQILKPFVNIKEMLEKYGYPFKSKDHSRRIHTYQNSGMGKTIKNYIGEGEKKTFTCPKMFLYNFTPAFSLKCSDKCCYKLKKEPMAKWQRQNNRAITITGIMSAEGGQRKSLTSCTIFKDANCETLKKFHPLQPLPLEWILWYIEEKKLEICKIYKEPYNFERTGCKGCPFALDLENIQEKTRRFFPNEYKQIWDLWQPVYKEYIKIGYRIKPRQYDLFEKE